MSAPAQPRYRVGVVNFVNTLPLIDGLERLSDVRLVEEVPSRLIDLILADEVDLALASIIDYQRSPVPLKIIPAGLLGCDGSTMTVRLFSRVPIQRVDHIFCDTDSHTSVTLLRILLHEYHRIRPELIDFDVRGSGFGGRGSGVRSQTSEFRGQKSEDSRDGSALTSAALTSGLSPTPDPRPPTPDEWPEAMLLIGDKVVLDATPALRYPWQLDLGAEWRELTGLPFVFATWLAKRDRPLGAVGAALDRQRRHNLERLEHILTHRLNGRGWPTDLARHYLRDMLRYEWTDEVQQGVERFFAYAHSMGLIDENRPLVFDAL